MSEEQRTTPTWSEEEDAKIPAVTPAQLLRKTVALPYEKVEDYHVTYGETHKTTVAMGILRDIRDKFQHDHDNKGGKKRAQVHYKRLWKEFEAEFRNRFGDVPIGSIFLGRKGDDGKKKGKYKHLVDATGSLYDFHPNPSDGVRLVSNDSDSPEPSDKPRYAPIPTQKQEEAFVVFMATKATATPLAAFKFYKAKFEKLKSKQGQPNDDKMAQFDYALSLCEGQFKVKAHHEKMMEAILKRIPVTLSQQWNLLVKDESSVEEAPDPSEDDDQPGANPPYSDHHLDREDETNARGDGTGGDKKRKRDNRSSGNSDWGTGRFTQVIPRTTYCSDVDDNTCTSSMIDRISKDDDSIDIYSDDSDDSDDDSPDSPRSGSHRMSVPKDVHVMDVDNRTTMTSETKGSETASAKAVSSEDLSYQVRGVVALQAEIEKVGKGRKEILNCETIKDFRIQRGKDKIVGYCLGRLFQDRGEQDPLEHAKDFSMKLVKNDANARILYEYIDVCLEYLFHLADKWNEGLITDTEMSSQRVCEIVHDILKLCLPMKRAREMYYKRMGKDTRPGADWVADRHLKDSTSQLKTHQIATIDERFYKFVETESLEGLYKHRDFTEWLQPKMRPHYS